MDRNVVTQGRQVGAPFSVTVGTGGAEEDAEVEVRDGIRWSGLTPWRLRTSAGASMEDAEP